MKSINRFIIIDDDPHNNTLCKFVIRGETRDIEILDFEFPVEGLQFIESFYGGDHADCPTVVFLDINMPVMTGWEFLEKYAHLNEDIKKQITIYILSSSVDWSDKEKASGNPYVKNYVIKPLSKGTISNILSGLL